MGSAEIHRVGWHTAQVDRIGAPIGTVGVSLRVLARWMLLCAVIAGVFVLHVLTSENDHNDHGYPLAGLATGQLAAQLGSGAGTQPDSPDAATVVATNSDPAAPLGDSDGGSLSGCILFLVVTGEGALLVLAQRQRVDASDPADVTGDATVMTRRGPPPAMVPRLALGVIRV